MSAEKISNNAKQLSREKGNRKKAYKKQANNNNINAYWYSTLCTGGSSTARYMSCVDAPGYRHGLTYDEPLHSFEVAAAAQASQHVIMAGVSRTKGSDNNGIHGYLLVSVQKVVLNLLVFVNFLCTGVFESFEAVLEGHTYIKNNCFFDTGE